MKEMFSGNKNQGITPAATLKEMMTGRACFCSFKCLGSRSLTGTGYLATSTIQC